MILLLTFLSPGHPPGPKQNAPLRLFVHMPYAWDPALRVPPSPTRELHNEPGPLSNLVNLPKSPHHQSTPARHPYRWSTPFVRAGLPTWSVLPAPLGLCVLIPILPIPAHPIRWSNH